MSNIEILQRFTPKDDQMDMIIDHVAKFTLSDISLPNEKTVTPQQREKTLSPKEIIDNFRDAMDSFGVSVKFSAPCRICDDLVELEEEHIDDLDMCYCGKNPRCCP